MKIIFFGTSNVALPVLELLHQHHDIAAVVTMPDAKSGRKQELAESPVGVLATEMELKLLKPESVKGNDLFRLELQNMQADIFVVVSYGKILPMDIISMPRYGTVNLHFSLLPKYRGSSPIQAALLNGDAQTGITIFLLDQQVDHGPILAQESVVIEPDDNFITLGDRLARISAKLLLNTLPNFVEGKIPATPQEDSEASHTNIITKQDGKIDWNKTSVELSNQFRAFYPWPGMWTMWNGKMLKITGCSLGDLSFSGQSDPSLSGTVMEGCLVVCGQNTFLQINSLQLEGKTETGILDFLNGYKEFIGSRLE